MSIPGVGLQQADQGASDVDSLVRQSAGVQDGDLEKAERAQEPGLSGKADVRHFRRHRDVKASDQKKSVHARLGFREDRRGLRAHVMASETVELARAEAASWAQMCPLIAAILGPLSVLLGIPALTQRWHGLRRPSMDPPYIPLPDPAVNLALAGVALFFEVMGNLFLILRFSNIHAKMMTWLSFGFWVAKIIVGGANYIQFGVTHPISSEVEYLQGFWVGIASMFVTVIIIMFLIFNLAFLHRQSPEERRRLHNVQREFMFQTLAFFFFLGITALIISRIEKLLYVDGIYYIVVCTLTIGFGDLVAVTAWTKVLTFPFAILGIALLALIVTSIVKLLSDRSRRQKMLERRSLRKREKAAKARASQHKAPGHRFKLRPWIQNEKTVSFDRELTLQEELENLRDESWKRERKTNFKRMAYGVTVFMAFWFLGALIFHGVEPWGYGNALYFCYIFFLTIGFGDFAPGTQAGRVVFIVYALLAVPTMTIIIETVTTNFTAFTMQRVRRRHRKLYSDQNRDIQSLTSLIEEAKEKSPLHRSSTSSVSLTHPVSRRNDDEEDSPDKEVEDLDNDSSPTTLSFFNIADDLIDRLAQLHSHITTILLLKLGPEAGIIIAAERARGEREDDRLRTNGEGTSDEQEEHDNLPAMTLQDTGSDLGNELTMLQKYREMYAELVAELTVARDYFTEIA